MHHENKHGELNEPKRSLIGTTPQRYDVKMEEYQNVPHSFR